MSLTLLNLEGKGSEEKATQGKTRQEKRRGNNGRE
jgi:hypothetical protein